MHTFNMNAFQRDLDVFYMTVFGLYSINKLGQKLEAPILACKMRISIIALPLFSEFND